MRLSTSLWVGLGAFHIWLASLASPFPYADEWQYVFIHGSERTTFWSWVLQPHVDHFIPLQKITQFGLLSIFGFDFRSLTVLNAVIVVIAVFFFIKTACLLQPKVSEHWSLSLFPLVMLLPSSNYLSLGFQFNFVTSLLMISLAGFFFAKFIQSVKSAWSILLCLSLFLNALLGGHGVIMSVVLGALLTGSIFGSRLPRLSKLAFASSMSAFVALPSLWIVSIWTPGEVTSRGINIEVTGIGLGNFLSGSLNVFLFQEQNFKVVAFLALLTFILVMTWNRNPEAYWSSSFWYSVLGSAFVTLGVVSAARSSLYENFENHLIIHYQALSIPIALSMIGLVTSSSSGLKNFASSVLGLFFSLSWIANLIWKTEVIPGQTSTLFATKSLIAQGATPGEIVNQSPRLFSWDSDPDGISRAIEGLSLLFEIWLR